MRPEQSLLQVIEEQGYRLSKPYIDRARTTTKFDVVFLFFVIEIVTEILDEHFRHYYVCNPKCILNQNLVEIVCLKSKSATQTNKENRA